ncbi:MAG: hypothetical protein J6I50_08540 [Clostridia bacterium]|nr:hypothetical protein [Clostridia bacterium]
MVKFPTPCSTPRPVRCTERTRQFAKDALSGIFGREALEHRYVTLPDEKKSEDAYKNYDLAIMTIAREAPLRICRDADGTLLEMLSGSATLGAAISHVVPATFNGTDPVCPSVSHLTCNFDRVVREGMDSYRQRILARMEDEGLTPAQKTTLASQLNAWEAMKVWHTRYLECLQTSMEQTENPAEKEQYKALYDTLTVVPFSPAKTFRQGVQSIWFTFAFIRLCGNWPGIGRMDLMLEDLYQADLAAGRITEAEARELLAHFFIKGCEWITLIGRGSGDAQHYQNLVLGGVDCEGVDRTGDVTRLILEIVEEFPIADFPIAVRVGAKSPAWITRKMAEVIRHGSGVVAMYNEDLIIDSLVGFGYDIKEARKFANDGCWEVQIPGRTRFIYSPMDLYGMFEREVLHLCDDQRVSYDSFDALYAAFRAGMDRMLDAFHAAADHFFGDSTTGVIDLFEDGCIEKALSYSNGGPVYNVFSPHFGGIPDVANALYAIQKLVYEEKRLSFADFMTVLKHDWEDQEALRLYVRNHYTYYGNDNDAVDAIAAKIIEDYVTDCRIVEKRNDVLRPPGISTFGRQIEWKDARTAAPHGFKKGSVLAGNISPTPSTDHKGATAIIKSACKADYSRLTCGTVLDIRLDPKAVSGEGGITAIEGLLRAFNALGGFFLQVDVVDNSTLLAAQQHPEDYESLAVRVSGWSARFVTLDKNWQDMIIARSMQEM